MLDLVFVTGIQLIRSLLINNRLPILSIGCSISLNAKRYLSIWLYVDFWKKTFLNDFLKLTCILSDQNYLPNLLGLKLIYYIQCIWLIIWLALCSWFFAYITRSTRKTTFYYLITDTTLHTTDKNGYLFVSNSILLVNMMYFNTNFNDFKKKK